MEVPDSDADALTPELPRQTPQERGERDLYYENLMHGKRILEPCNIAGLPSTESAIVVVPG